MTVDVAFDHTVASYLRDHAGSYLVNAIVPPNFRVCRVCRTELEAPYATCFPCSAHARSGYALADVVGFTVYVVGRGQAHRTMRAYKADLPQEHAVQVVSALLYFALAHHVTCLNALAGAPASLMCTVPSLSERSGVHPLEDVLSRVRRRLPPLPPSAHVTAVSPGTEGPRALEPNHFRVHTDIAGGHVLLIDDTWASGAHMQSLAAALHLAGAARVSALCVARYINPTYEPTARLAARVNGDGMFFDPTRCPWTPHGNCP